MNRLAILGTFGLCAVALASCGGDSDKAVTFYVLAPAAKTTQFTDDLARISERYGLESNLGQARADKGYVLYVLDAKSWLVRLWGQNVPLSGREEVARCGPHGEARPDPGQFVVTIDRRVPLIADGEPARLSKVIFRDLQGMGYEVRVSPLPCSSLARTN